MTTLVRTVMFGLSLFVASTTYAHDFVANNIAFNKLSANTVEVTYREGAQYSGEILIPKKVEYEKTSYIVTGIGDDAFSGSGSLVSVKINAPITRVGNGAFSTCTALKEIILPASVTEIGKYAFRDCKALKNIVLPKKINKLSEFCFSSCSNLETIDIPSSVTAIENNAFSKCTHLANIKFSPNITTLDNNAFSGCISLKVLVLPQKLYMIGKYCFADCSSLTTISPIKASIINEGAFSGCSMLPNINLEEGVTTLGDFAFSDCSALTDFKMPNSIITLSKGVLKNCTGLKSVTISNHITKLPQYMFEHCSNIKKITIPESVKMIEGSAFYNCSNLEQIFIPASVNRIFAGAFAGCRKLENIDLDQHNESFTVYDGILYDKQKKKLLLAFKDCETYNIPNTVEVIEGQAFTYMLNLKRINIPASVTKIGPRVFSRCDNLHEFTVDKDNSSFTAVDNILFDKNQTTILKVFADLTSYTTPSGVKAISNHAFAGSQHLKEIIVGESVTDIQNSAFARCESLEKITFLTNNFQRGNNLLQGCKNLKEIVIGKDNNVFTLENNILYNKDKTTLLKAYGNLKNYKISQSTKTIVSLAFYDCTNIESIEIPENVTTLGLNNFTNCKDIKMFKVNWMKPIYVKSNAMFSSETLNKCILIVPDLSVKTYRDNEFWGRFRYIEPNLNEQ